MECCSITAQSLYYAIFCHVKWYAFLVTNLCSRNVCIRGHKWKGPVHNVLSITVRSCFRQTIFVGHRSMGMRDFTHYENFVNWPLSSISPLCNLKFSNLFPRIAISSFICSILSLRFPVNRHLLHFNRNLHITNAKWKIARKNKTFTSISFNTYKCIILPKTYPCDLSCNTSDVQVAIVDHFELLNVTKSVRCFRQAKKHAINLIEDVPLQFICYVLF